MFLRKAQLCEQLAPPARTVAAGGTVMTQLRRLVAPLTPEAGTRRHRPRPRRSAALSVSGLEGQVAALEAALTRPRSVHKLQRKRWLWCSSKGL